MGSHATAQHLPRTANTEPDSWWTERRTTYLPCTNCHVDGAYESSTMAAMDVSKLTMADAFLAARM